MNDSRKQMRKVAVLYVPQWWKMHRIVWGGDGLSPTITVKADHIPNILVEVARDDPDKDRQRDRMDGRDGRGRDRPKLPREGKRDGTICTGAHDPDGRGGGVRE